MTTEKTPAPKLRYGSFNIRVLACALDLGCITMATMPLTQWAMEKIFPLFDPTPLAELNTATNFIAGVIILVKICQEHPVLWERMVTTNVLQAGFIALYTLPFWFTCSSTPGKMLFGMEIRDAKTGKRMTRSQCVFRFLGYIISFLPLTLGFAFALLNKKRRGLHDYIAGTVVLVKPPAAE